MNAANKITATGHKNTKPGSAACGWSAVDGASLAQHEGPSLWMNDLENYDLWLQN